MSHPAPLIDSRFQKILLLVQGGLSLLWLLLTAFAWPAVFEVVFQAVLLAFLGSAVILWFGFRSKGVLGAKKIVQGLYLGFLYKFFLIFVGIMSIAFYGALDTSQWAMFLIAFGSMQVFPVFVTGLVLHFTYDPHVNQ